LASTWTALVAGFGGMRARQGDLTFAPRLPSALSRLSFRVCYRGRRISVTLRGTHATYELLAGDPLELSHHGTMFELAHDPVELDVPPAPALPPPQQPFGREPIRRRPMEPSHDG
jgi:alpha,alpha-trehalose phosphorylase